jgi:ATP-binding cassette subfamily G (WHITE) protein 2 (SNQ2)
MDSSNIFALTQMLAEMPYSVGCAVAFFLVCWSLLQ